MSTTKPQLIWIYKNSPVSAGEIKSVKNVNDDGWYLTVDKKLIDPHWCCPVTDWQEYNGGFALFEQNTGSIVEIRDIKKYLVAVGDWVDEVAIASCLGLSMQQVRSWLKNNQQLLLCREVIDGHEWRLRERNDNGSQKSTNCGRNDNGSQKVNELFTFNLDNAETLEDFEQLIRDNLLAYYTVGKALIEIRDRQLYIDLPDINTFEEYCQSPLTALKLGIKTKRRAYQLIDAAKIMDVLKSERIVHLPTNENQIRSIATLEPHEWKKAWLAAIDESDGKPPTGAIVTDVVRQMKLMTTGQMKIQNPYVMGDVLRFTSNGDPQTRTRNKRWAIVVAVGEFTCTVSDFEGEFVAHVNQLEKLEITSKEKQAVVRLRDRLARIAPTQEVVKMIVNYFARKQQINLDEQEERILNSLNTRHDHEENSSL